MSKRSILGFLLVGVGLSAIAWGSIGTFDGLFGAGALLLLFEGVWLLREKKSK